MYGHLDIIFVLFSHVSQLHVTPHAPRSMFYFVAILIWCRLVFEIRCCDQFGASGEDNNCEGSGGGPCAIYDPTQRSARQYIWSLLRAGYYQHGIKVFWLDGSEPEISTTGAYQASRHYNNSLGLGQQVGMMYPYFHTQMVHDGLISEGESSGEIMQLTRSGWAGMQRFGAALWSGDTASSWAVLKASIPAGLNTQMSGIAWWTTDIGGYGGGKPSDPGFRELIVRW